jgi:hypothetical protein
MKPCRFLERIEDIYTTIPDVRHISGHEYQPMDISRCGKACVVNVLLALAEQFAPAGGHRLVDGQDAPLICREARLGGSFNCVRQAGITRTLPFDPLPDFADVDDTNGHIEIVDCCKSRLDILVRLRLTDLLQ